MTDKLIGMYVLMMWGYNYPYAARTWQLKDWSAYLEGLRALGYNLVQIWPFVDAIPVPMTPSDRALLATLRQVIDVAHELGMTVYIGSCANTMANDKAGDYDFESRPYFTVQKRIDPTDRNAVAELMTTRRELLDGLAEADGFWVIDSDPGGYPGSSPSAFADLFTEYRRMLDTLRPGIRLYYWMWAGWTDAPRFDPEWRDTPQACWREALARIVALNPEPWGIMACWPGHFSVIEELGQEQRTLYFAYNTIEHEPDFPFTNCDPEFIQRAFDQVPPDGFPVGVMGNAQSHCLQMPHTYFFRHFADGGASEDMDLAGFADDVLPGHGAVLSAAWLALGGEDCAALESAAAELATHPPLTGGKYIGLYLGQPDRLVGDLVAQIKLKIAILKLRDRLAGNDSFATELQEMVMTLAAWAQQHGYTDRFRGPFRTLIRPVLEQVAMQTRDSERLRQAMDGCDARDVNGVFTELLDSLKGLQLK